MKLREAFKKLEAGEIKSFSIGPNCSKFGWGIYPEDLDYDVQHIVVVPPKLKVVPPKLKEVPVIGYMHINFDGSNFLSKDPTSPLPTVRVVKLTGVDLVPVEPKVIWKKGLRPDGDPIAFPSVFGTGDEVYDLIGRTGVLTFEEDP
jgi:hypothetical protein